MDSELYSPPSESAGTKAAFRKPSNDAANRNYRRRSPVCGSSSADGSPSRDRSNSPTPSRDDHAKVLDNRRRRDDERDFERDHGKSQYGRSGDSYRHSGRPSSRSSHNYHKNEDYVRREKHAEEDQRNISKSSPRMRAGSQSDYARRESEHNRSRDHLHNVEKHSRDRSDGSGHKSRDKDRESSSHEYHKYKDKDSSDRVGSGRRQTNFNTEEFKPGERDKHKRDGDDRDEKRDYRKTSQEHRSDRSPSFEESRGLRPDALSRRDSSGHTLKEASRRDFKEMDGPKYTKEEKDKYYDRETNRRKERHTREAGELVEDRTALSTDDKVSPVKKPKLFSLDKGMDQGEDASKHTTMADKIQSTSSKEAQESIGKVNKEQDFVKHSDIDAAKVAAMKAAELVNRNLIGTGYMSTDQKKKLLWGSKKATATEEPTHRWDTSLFSDRERQEKFNKLMGVKGDVKVDHKPDNQDGSGLLQAEKQKELQLDLEKQYTAGLRRRDGRTVGLGL